MITSSTELIKAAKEALNKMLTRQMEKDMQPSFYDMYFRGFNDGLYQGKDMTAEDIARLNEWHYIEFEGNPDNDDSHFVLYEYDGKYKDTTYGFYEDGRWHLDYHPSGCDYRVLAWHTLPKIPE